MLGFDNLLHHIEKWFKNIFLLFSLLLFASKSFQFHVHATDFSEKLQKYNESRLQQEFKNLGGGVDYLLHHIEKKIV